MPKVKIDGYTFPEPAIRAADGPHEIVLFDDFFEIVPNGTLMSHRWDVFKTNAGATVQVLTGTSGGELVITQAGNLNDVVALQSSMAIKQSELKPGAPIVFGVRFKRSLATTGHVHIGLGVKHNAYVESEPANYCMLHIAHGANTITLKARKDSITNSATVGSLTADTWERLVCEYLPSVQSGATGRLTCWRNGRFAASFDVATFPNTAILHFGIHFQQGAAVAETDHVDWVYLRSERNITEGVG